jgi:hypothetical protein
MLLITVVTILGLVIYDIYVATNNIPHGIGTLGTLGSRMKIWGKKTLLIPWAWAVLFGHFFGPIKSGELVSSKFGIALLIFSTWCIVALGEVLRDHGVSIDSSWLWFFLILNIGSTAGACFWPQ